jgi:hypothetical protein
MFVVSRNLQEPPVLTAQQLHFSTLEK